MRNSKIYNDGNGDYIVVDKTGYKSYIKWASGRPKWVQIQQPPKMSLEDQECTTLYNVH